MDKFTRLLSLVALLEQREYPQTFEAIKDQLRGEAYPQANPETARRSFERDKDDLVAMGVPLETVDMPEAEAGKGYTIRRRRTEISDPGFTPSEFAALRMAARAMALRHQGVEDFADATDGLRKFGGLAQDGESAPEQTDPVAVIRLDDNITALFSGIIDRTEVAFTHGGRTRHVLPRHLFARSGKWYLNCHDLDEAESRTYRLDRIEGAVIPASDRSGDTRSGVGEEAEAPSMRFRPWEFGSGESVAVRVALDEPAAAVALAEHPALETAPGDADRIVFTLSVRSPDGLWNWLLQFMDRAVVLEPPEMRSAYLEHVSALAEGSAPR